MGETPLTRPSLLLRVRNPLDADAWRQFVELYAPLVYQFGRRRGLQDADAADLAQTVFAALARDLRRFDYDPDRGSFRGWLLVVVRNQLVKQLARERRTATVGSGGDDSLLAEIPDRQSDEAVWDEEYERRLFRWAAERVRVDFEERSWRAFWLAAVDGLPPKEVARELGMSVGAVYTAKSRVLDRMKQAIEEIQAAENRASNAAPRKAVRELS
jgi:RNA polymerase sigma-70 factor (ECF subfamily)